MSIIIEAINHHNPDGIALIGDDKKLTYGELAQEINLKAESLKGCRVLGLALDNGIDWVLWDLAALKAGVVCVPIPSFFTKDQRSHIIGTAGISHIISTKGLNETGSPASDKIPEGTSKITFTSGSTGTPKGVCLVQEKMEDVTQSIVTVLGGDYAGEHLSVLPLSVLLENVAGVYSALFTGCRCHVYSPAKIGMKGAFMPDLTQMINIMRDKDITSAILVPELLNGLINVLVKNKIKLPHLKFLAVGGSKTAPELIKKSRDAGLPVYEGYGLSECGSVVSLNTPDCDKPGTSGKLLPHIKAKVQDGEIIISNPSFLGYLGQPQQEGDFSTGDLGSISEDGFVSVSGRKKNILITSYGRNVSPEWVESYLIAQPEIMQAFVYGDAQPHISALLVPTSLKADLNKAVDRVNELLPDYAQVKTIHAIGPFSAIEGTLSGVGRPKRNVIAKKYERLIKNEEIKDLNTRLEYETGIYRATLYNIPQIIDALQGKITLESYIAFLTETYHYVKHTVPLLVKMREKLSDRSDWMLAYLNKYIEDETGEEDWILENIAAMGGDKEAVRHSQPSKETADFCAYSYDCIDNKNPLGFLGVIFMLENASKQLAAQGSKAVKASLGAADEGLTYLDSHAKTDEDTQEGFLEETFKRICAKEDQDDIIKAAQDSFLLFADILRAIPNEAVEGNNARFKRLRELAANE